MGGLLAQQGPAYVQPAPVYMPPPQPVYAYPQPAYVPAPVYAAPMYRRWGDDDD